MNKTTAIVLLALSLIALAGCGDGEAEKQDSATGSRSAEERRGEDVLVSASVNSPSVDIGARVIYRVEVRFRGEVEVDWPPILDGLDHQIVYDTGIWTEGDRIGSYRVRSLETVLDPGIGPVLTIAPTSIRWRRTGEERWHEARTDAITVEVTSVAEGAPDFQEPLDFFDLPDPPVAAQENNRRAVFAILGGGLLLMAVVFFVLFRKKKMRAIVPPTPEEVALAELDRLDELGLLEPARVRELYYRLAAILRRYVEGRFGIEAPEQTTEEFLAGLRSGTGSTMLPDDRKAALEGFMRVADLVRYARHEPPHDEVRGAVIMLRDFVESSRPARGAETPEKEEVVHAL